MEKKLLVLLIALCLLFNELLTAYAGEWETMPMITQKMRDDGLAGGEGGQWEQAIAVDSIDGSVVVSGTDVGGLFISTDGGKQFYSANIGFYARGTSGVTIDPNNNSRILAVGANPHESIANGIYLSKDKGQTWSHTLKRTVSGKRDFREQVVFDKSSYDEKIGGSKIAYWTSNSFSEDSTGRLFKSTDGGETWFEIPNSAAYGKSNIKVHPTKGYVYITNEKGFFKSTDGGVSFTQKVQGEVGGMDVIITEPDYVYINKTDGVYVSTDSAETFTKKGNAGFPAGGHARYLKVSPADKNRMLICSDTPDWFKKIYRTTDGGERWVESTIDKTTNNFLPYNNRQSMFAWHPTDPNIVWSFGGDWTTKSTDGGAVFKWNHNGNTGIMIGGHFSFNIFEPDILYFGSQDYNGALTTNGGYTWKYINFSQRNSAGHCYGGYAADANTMFVGVAGHWEQPRRLKITRDQGVTIEDTGLDYNGLDYANGCPTDPNVFFASDLRSADKGYTWSRMTDCKAVVTYNPIGDKELYGINESSVVKSTDKGETWSIVAKFPTGVRDIAYDHVNNRIYAATFGHRLFKWEADTITEITSNIPNNQYDARHILTVAVDPVSPNIVYAGGPGNRYINDTSVVRSTDGGNTWEVLTRNLRNSVTTGNGAGYEAISIRVHPKTRELYVATGCFGWAKIKAPSDEKASADIEKTEDIKDKLNEAVVLFLGKAKALVKNKETRIDASNAEVVPLVQDGRTLVPVRFISESLGADVEWDGNSSCVTVKMGQRTINMILGKKVIIVNNEEKTLDVPAQTISGRTMIPLRAMAEALDKKVFWDDRGLIIISDIENIINKDQDEELMSQLLQLFD